MVRILNSIPLKWRNDPYYTHLLALTHNEYHHAFEKNAQESRINLIEQSRTNQYIANLFKDYCLTPSTSNPAGDLNREIEMEPDSDLELSPPDSPKYCKAIDHTTNPKHQTGNKKVVVL